MALVEHLLDLDIKLFRSAVAPHNEQGGVISCQTPHHVRDLHLIQSGTGTGSQAWHGFQHDQILGQVNAGDTLPQDLMKPLV
jgi:hypothetical protein